MERTQNVAQALSPVNSTFSQSPAPLFSQGANPFAVNHLFAPRPQNHDVPADAPEGSYTYALVQSAPDVPAHECEVSDASVEIMIFWGSTVLHCAHLTPPRSFYVGEQDCDFCLPAEKIGAARIPVLLAEPGGRVKVVLAAHAKGTIEMAGQSMTVQQAIEHQKARPCQDLPGAHEIDLGAGAKVKIDLNGIVLQIADVNAGRAFAGRAPVDTRSLSYQGLSMALHLGMLAAAALLMPPLGTDEGSSITADQKYYMQQMIQATAESEPDKLIDLAAKDLSDAPAELAKGPAGPLNPNPGASGGRLPSTANQPDRSGPPMDAHAVLEDAKRFGMVELLNASMRHTPGAAPAPWGNLAVNDPSRSVLDTLWGDEPGGPGGLDLTTIGESGGPGGGVKGGPIGTVNGGSGDPNGIPGRRFPPGGHDSRAPGFTPNPLPNSEGSLPPELIQRTVRQNFGRFRMCYQDGLRTNPSLAGRVSVRFVIGRDGSVSSVGNGGSDLPDSSVVACVVRAFYGVSFPPPNNGIVRVTYPIVFSPS
jgi:hypothetical protein